MKFGFALKLAVVLSATGACFAAQDAQAPRLSIVIVEGEGAINNIKQRTSRETIVEVQDENHRPVAGAAVVFLLPNDGPGGAFAGGSKTATLVTDSAGRSTMPNFQPNQVNGNFQIRVNASTGRPYAASATISQSRMAPRRRRVPRVRPERPTRRHFGQSHRHYRRGGGCRRGRRRGGLEGAENRILRRGQRLRRPLEPSQQARA